MAAAKHVAHRQCSISGQRRNGSASGGINNRAKSTAYQQRRHQQHMGGMAAA